MGMKISRWMGASPEVVFAACTDFEHAADHVEGIVSTEMLTEGPVGVGTRFRETRVMFGREATEEMEVTQFEPGKSYTLEAESCGTRYSTRMDFQAEGQGCRVTMDVEAHAVTFMAKLMSPLCWFMSGMMKKCLEQDLESIASRVETPPSAAVT